MGNPRPRPALLHKKFVAIREFLDVSQPTIAIRLKLAHAGRVSEYENDLREPNLTVLLQYSYLGRVHMESLVDDQVGLAEFRKELGTVEPKHRAAAPPQEASQLESPIQSKHRPKPLTLIHGSR